MLKDTFINLCKKYSNDLQTIELLWNEIETQYSSNKRFYHNLSHLENILTELNEIKEEINNRNAIIFSTFYHDIIYQVTKNNNEELSAEFAKTSLQKINVPKNIIEICFKQIIATKKHSQNIENDTNIFIDADLSILGKSWKKYYTYTKLIRKEYSIFPSILYKKGRKKVINHFLNSTSIYKTAHFINRYEENARNNLLKELSLFKA